MPSTSSLIHDFRSALKSSSKLSSSSKLISILPPDYPEESLLYPNYITLLAGISITASYPHYYDMDNFNSYCILYTEEGSGYLRYENRTYYLDPFSLVFFDCRILHHIEIQHAPWKHKLLFIKGAPISHFYDIFSCNNDVILLVGNSSYLPGLIEKIINADSAKDYLTLDQNRRLTDLLTEITIEKRHGYLPKAEAKSHVIEIKNMFDSHCEFHYTLSWLEEHFNISRYRLCREFKEAEGVSLIAYLNRVRMDTAKHLLRSTTMRINEIALAVGIENMNHFIRLFKSNTGTTPTNYRG